MRELGLVGAILVVMAVVSSIWLTPWETLYYKGMWVTAIGFAMGVPAGIVYHVRLYQVLHPRGELPRGWYWSPIRFNRCLPPEVRRGVLSWCYAGAFGFVIICVGLVMMGGGLSMALIRGV